MAQAVAHDQCCALAARGLVQKTHGGAEALNATGLSVNRWRYWPTRSGRSAASPRTSDGVVARRASSTNFARPARKPAESAELTGLTVPLLPTPKPAKLMQYVFTPPRLSRNESPT